MFETLNFTTLLKVFLQNFQKNGEGGGRLLYYFTRDPNFPKNGEGGFKTFVSVGKAL